MQRMRPQPRSQGMTDMGARMHPRAQTTNANPAQHTQNNVAPVNLNRPNESVDMYEIDKKIKKHLFPTLYCVASHQCPIYQDDELRFPLERIIKKDEVLQVQKVDRIGDKHIFKTYFINENASVDCGYFVGFDDTSRYITNLSLVPIFPNAVDVLSI